MTLSVYARITYGPLASLVSRGVGLDPAEGPHRWCDGTRWGRGYPKLIRIAWGCVSFILFRPVPPMHQVEGVAVDSLSRDSIYSIRWVGCVPEPVSPTGAADAPHGEGVAVDSLFAIVYTVYVLCVLCLCLCRRPVPPMHQVERVGLDPPYAIVYTVCGVCAVSEPVLPTGGRNESVRCSCCSIHYIPWLPSTNRRPPPRPVIMLPVLETRLSGCVRQRAKPLDGMRWPTVSEIAAAPILNRTAAMVSECVASMSAPTKQIRPTIPLVVRVMLPVRPPKL